VDAFDRRCPGCCQSWLGVLVTAEIQLRIGQANDSLERLRTHLGQKSVLHQMQVRSSASVRTDMRAKNDIKRLILKINRDVHSYHRAWEAIISLGASDDLSIDKEVTECNGLNFLSYLICD